MGKYQVQVVNCYHLNVRTGPSTSNKIVAVIHRGEKYTSSKQSNGWYYIDEKKGYASGKYLKVVKNLSSPPSPKPKPKTPAPPKNQPNYAEIWRQLGRETGTANIVKLTPDKYQTNYLSNYEDLGTIDAGDSAEIFINGYELDYTYVKDNLNIIRRNYNIMGDLGYRSIIDNLFDKFNRFKVAFPDQYLSKTFSYVFFTRPSLNLMNDEGTALNSQFNNDPLFYYLYNNNPKLILSLTDKFSSTHDFHPYLSNTASSFELSDEFIKTIEHGETLTGYKVQYGKNNIESNSAGTFSIQYTDDAEFNVYKTHKAWIEYISRVYRGEVRPKREFIQKKILDYAVSVYYFICGPDGETILFWSKYFGVFPTNTPASASSWAKGSGPKLPEFTINYAYAMKEDFSPLSLIEFNMNSEKMGHHTYKLTYERALLSTGKTFSNAPFVELTKDSTGSYIYKLRFRA
jgi:hypothetical protein